MFFLKRGVNFGPNPADRNLVSVVTVLARGSNRGSIGAVAWMRRSAHG